ncbi:substrate-binding domain-containing protein [Psychromonas sp.]|uniref:ABC transporter substrate-binding protein n=1 Tax=Psychromonas sp. TaxID=1884585 RepID=UPI003A977497
MLFSKNKLAKLTTLLLVGNFSFCGIAFAKDTYALVQINQQALFFNLMNKGAESAATQSDKNLVIYNSNNKPIEQNNAIETYIQQGVKGILIDAIDVNGVMPAIEEAHLANIPVVAIDATLPQGTHITQIGVNNYKGGTIIGQSFVDYVNTSMGSKANVGIVGALNAAVQIKRQKGFEDTIKSQSGIKVVDVVDGENVQDKAMSASENLLTANPDINAIYATGEPALLGAIAAVESQGMQDQVKVFGWDLSAEAVNGIDSGFVVAVLQQDPEEMGRVGVNSLNAYLSGKKIDKEISVPPTVVNKANVDQYRPLFK